MNIKQQEVALEKIAKEIKACKICQVAKIGQAVPGEGSTNAEVVFMGEAPGKVEAQTGRPSNIYPKKVLPTKQRLLMEWSILKNSSR